MKTVVDTPASQHYSAGNSLRPINFYCSAPGAKSVDLAGDFNQWHPLAMRQRDHGWWFVQVELPHGHHQYRFVVDGRSILDPLATGTARDRDNQPVSLIAVS